MAMHHVAVTVVLVMVVFELVVVFVGVAAVGLTRLVQHVIAHLSNVPLAGSVGFDCSASPSRRF
jgi:hypothetical protein